MTMAVVELTDNDVLPERSNYDLQLERDPTFRELARANFQNENLLVNASNAAADKVNSLLARNANDIMGRMLDLDIDKDYDVFEDPRITGGDYAGYADRFIGAESRYEVDQTIRNIDRELENKATMAAGGLEGVAAGLAVGFTDPTMLIPIGGAAYKTYRTGGTILKGAARTGLATGTVVGASEVALQSLQETRTAEESAWNIAGATFLGGVVGGSASAFGGRKNLEALGKRVEEELTVPQFNDSVGAARATETTLDDEALKSAAGLEKLFSFQDPLLRMATSPAKTARTQIERLAELPLTRNKNTQGVASEISVENRIKSYELPKYLYGKERDRLFLEYRNSKSKLATNIGDKADQVFKRSRKDGMLTYNEFKEAVVHAGRRGDQHDIPQVAAAAAAKRKIVTDPIFNAAKETGLIDPGTVAPATAQSYVNRLWDHGAIKANRREFEQLNAQHLLNKRNRAAADLQEQFKLFDLDNNSRVAQAVQAERDALKFLKESKTSAVKKEAEAGAKAEQTRININELKTRLDDATKNQERIYNKILNKRERGDEDMNDLFFEFKSVSAAKRDLYKSLMAKESKGEINTKEFWRREQIANYLDEQERLLETKMAALEDQAKLMEDLEYRTSFDEADFDSISYKLTDRILGTSVGRLSYDNKVKTGSAGGRGAKRGPAKARVYDIPDEMVEKFLVNDDDMLTESYVRSLASDIELTRTFGSIDPEDALKAIQDDYEALAKNVTDSNVLEKLNKAKNNDLRDFKAVWDRLRGTFGNNGDDYASGFRSAERAAMNINYLSMLGGMTISAFSDVARPVMVHGLKRTFGEGFTSLFTNTEAFMKAAKDVRETGTALDMVNNTRAKALFGMDEFMPFQNKAEAVTGAMAQNFGVISAMAPWNASMKQFVGVVTQNRMVKSIMKLAEDGKVAPKELEYLAANFVDKPMAKRIAAQFAEHGEKSGTVRVPNARNWTDIEAAEAFRAAVRKQVDQIIVTPGQDKPLWMSKSGWRLMGQFRSFAFASMQRTVLAGLQQRDMAVLNGTLLSVALGSLSYMTKMEIAGKDADMSVDTLLREGVDRSGVMAWLTDANQIVEKVSRGRVGVSALMGGPPMSRYASRSAAEAVFGPTYGMLMNSVQLTGNAFAGDWQAADTHTVRRMMPYNNLFYLRSIFDDAESGVNEVLGVKGK